MSCPKCGFISDYSKVDGSFLEYGKGKDCPMCGFNESIGKAIANKESNDGLDDKGYPTSEEEYPYKKTKKKKY